MTLASRSALNHMVEKSKLRILLVGSGGREHALGTLLEKSPLVDQIYVAPGNAGTEIGEKISNVNIKVDDFEGLTSFAEGSHINLVIVGPEQPLVDGVEKFFRRVGVPIFGPSQAAAALEGSKTYSKDFMRRHGIPTASYANFSDFEAAREYVQSCTHRIVIKASGLAAGKGVLLPQTTEEAVQGLQDIMLTRAFGDAGEEVVIEEYLEGQELSVLAFSDGYTILPLPGAQDHKQIGDGDTGPNTGGMGAYSPAPIATPALSDEVMRTILKPTLTGMRQDGRPFVGLLFVGLMITPSGPKVLEYNVRFGDPETQTLLPLLTADTDIAEIILACVNHRLDCVNFKIEPKASVTVVIASGGYPTAKSKDMELSKPITIGTLPRGVTAFHAGTTYKADQLLNTGGRVLGVNAVAATLEEAAALAYEGVKAIRFDGMIYRKDIAYRALKRGTSAGEPPESSTAGQGLTYADAGVSIDAGNQLVSNIKPLVKATRRPGADGEIGGFGGVFDLKAAGYSDPVLVSGTDGVGTKLRIAQSVGKHDTVGIDLVAMSVNDLIVQGAEPLYFLDYFACGKLDVVTATDVIKGIAEGCQQAGCALVGGETAEMPSMYSGDDYDLAGFAVGAVERTEVLPRPDVKPGDVILGLASSGVHSNGFSLVRKIISNLSLSFSSPCPWSSESPSIGHALLIPTVIYVRQLLSVLRTHSNGVKALSHITGGGFLENIPRVLPTGCGARIDASSYALPGVFAWLMKAGGIEAMEMARTFNCGIGMIVVVEAGRVDDVAKALDAFEGGAKVTRIGQVIKGEGVKMEGLESWHG